jgi:rubrerythrin
VYNTCRKVFIAGKEHFVELMATFNRTETISADKTKEWLAGRKEGGTQVEDAIPFLREKDRTLEDLIEVSMQVKANALDLYVRMRRVIKNDSAEQVFSSLIGEEKGHLSRLGGLLGKKLEERRGERHA